MALQFAGPRRDIRMGPFTIRVRAEVPALRGALETLYADFPNAAPAGGFADFHVRLAPLRGWRRWLSPRVGFDHDGYRPYGTLQASQSLLMFEGGLNWTIAENANFFMVIHAAAIERGGRAAIFPAPSGSGKSTLCAALISRGWRLMSDELTLISLAEGTVSALARPISLKNEAIDAIRRFAPESVFSAPIPDTQKGTVAFLKPPRESVARMAETAVPAWVILPRYAPGAPACLTPRGKADTFMALHDNAYNDYLFGRAGFEVLAALIDCCQCYDFAYGELADAVASFDALAEGRV